MIYITGDTHGEFLRFNTSSFPEQKQMSKDDYVIICGDFGGIWDQAVSSNERYWLDWLENKPFSLLFVDGNHENHARLNSEEFEKCDFSGGKAQKIRENIYHLLRGQVYTIEGKRFFTFGGAASHDIDDGILDPESFKTKDGFKNKERIWIREKRRFRVKNISWWEAEMPCEEEMEQGFRALEKVDYKVDYVISHCLPDQAGSLLTGASFAPDQLTGYFSRLLENGFSFERWFCGHYHSEQIIMEKYQVLYKNVIRIL